MRRFCASHHLKAETPATRKANSSTSKDLSQASVFPGEEKAKEKETACMYVQEEAWYSEQLTVMLTCCWTFFFFMATPVERKALKLPGEIAHSDDFEGGWSKRGTWQSITDTRTLYVL